MGCRVVRAGDRLSEPGLVFHDGLFAEEIDGRNADIAVTVTKLKHNFLVHVGFKAKADRPYVVVPPDAVKIVSTSILRPALARDVPEGLEVVKLRFKDNEQVTVGADLWTFGYLFFPFDELASNVTVVVKVRNETFRFPFASRSNNPLEWSDPQAEMAVDSALVKSAPALTATPTHTSATSSTAVPTAPVAATPATTALTTAIPAPATPATASLAILPGHDHIASGCSAQSPVDAVIAFGIADRNGVHPGVMGWTRNWINKNAKNFPMVAFQGCSAEGLRNYLIVFSSSENVLTGFDPVLKSNTSTSTSPMSGTGSISDMYGSTWNYRYDGTVTTTTTTTTQENVPYTIQSNTLYATAYDEHGIIISQRWHTFSSKQGGDAANSLGYNLGSVLAAMNARGRLLNAVVKDIAGTSHK
jgi:hypothetical protein